MLYDFAYQKNERRSFFGVSSSLGLLSGQKEAQKTFCRKEMWTFRKSERGQMLFHTTVGVSGKKSKNTQIIVD